LLFDGNYGKKQALTAVLDPLNGSGALRRVSSFADRLRWWWHRKPLQLSSEHAELLVRQVQSALALTSGSAGSKNSSAGS
jgi:hypothetical protein